MLITLAYLEAAFFLTHVLGYSYLLLLSKWFKAAPEKPMVGLTNIVALAAMAVAAGVSHLFFPVDHSLWFFFIPQFFILFKKDMLFELLDDLKTKKTIVAGLFVAAVAAVVSRPGTGDIGDYHLQGILWSKFYPNIVGLGNFNRPLANNNWWFNLQALFGNTNLSLYYLNALFYISLMLFLLLDGGKNMFLHAFKLPLLLFLALSTKTAFVGSVTPDYIVTGLIFLSAYLFLKWWFERNTLTPYLMLILSCFAITVKLNAIVLLLPAAYALWVQHKNQLNTTVVLNTLAIGTLFFIPWLIGNVMVSGWLAYPVNIIDLFDVDWKVPEEILAYERFSIKQWGKIPGNDIYETAKLSLSQWFPIWFSNNDLFNKSLIIGAPMLLLTALPLLIKQKQTALLVLVVFALVGTAFCFSNGPHIRYAYGYIFTGIAASFGYWYQRLVNIQLRQTLVLFVLLSLLPSFLSLYRMHQINTLVQSFIFPPEYAQSTAQPAKIGTPNHQESVYITPTPNNCWDLFPCSYYMVEGCTLRGNTFNEGFKVLK